MINGFSCSVSMALNTCTTVAGFDSTRKLWSRRYHLNFFTLFRVTGGERICYLLGMLGDRASGKWLFIMSILVTYVADFPLPKSFVTYEIHSLK